MKKLIDNEKTLKKLKSLICEKIIHRELAVIEDKIDISIYIKDIKLVDNKLHVEDIRISGSLVFANGVKHDLADVSYKMTMNKSGLTSIIITHAIHSILSTVLKHFNIEDYDFVVGKCHFMKKKRFYTHLKK